LNNDANDADDLWCIQIEEEDKEIPLVVKSFDCNKYAYFT